MKHTGSLMECSEERVIDLMKAYDDYILRCSHIRMPDVYRHIASLPAPRFYVSEIRASVVVSAMLSGRSSLYSGMRALKREMFFEICRRVKLVRTDRPWLSVLECCREVVVQPAPLFYISPSTVKCIICKYREQWKKKKIAKINRWTK